MSESYWWGVELKAELPKVKECNMALKRERDSYLSQALNHGITIIKLKEDMKELEAALQKETEAADFGLNQLEAELAISKATASAEAAEMEAFMKKGEELQVDNAQLRECLKRSELICGNCGKLAERHNEAVHLRDVISALEHEIVAKDARIRELEDGLVMEQTLHQLDHAAGDALKSQVDREAK
jgi:uncharacterized protein YydD (DUF2326 family)